jgi:hypothetical protein
MAVVNQGQTERALGMLEIARILYSCPLLLYPVFLPSIRYLHVLYTVSMLSAVFFFLKIVFI